jgi:hypothetical protein
MARISYPTIDLVTALAQARIAANNLPPGILFTRSNLRQALGYSEKSGRGNSVIGALSHYGFIQKLGDRYSFTPRIKRLLSRDTSYKEQTALLLAALKTPAAFKNLYDTYGEKAPRADAIQKLVDEFHIPVSSARAIISNYNLSYSYIKYSSQREYTEATPLVAPQPRTTITATVTPPTSVVAPTIEDDTVLITFDHGVVIPVPKRIILKAYVDELQKLQQRYS